MTDKVVFGRGVGFIGWCQMKMEMVVANYITYTTFKKPRQTTNPFCRTAYKPAEASTLNPKPHTKNSKQMLTQIALQS